MSTETLTSVEKSINILKALGNPPYEFKVQELSDLLNINRTSVYRILKILESNGVVVNDPNSNKYKVGSELYHLGVSYLYHNNYGNQIQDILAEISDLTRESVGLAIKDRDKIMSIFEVEIHQPMKLNDTPGKYFPVNKGCYGKCIMAYQDADYINNYLDNNTFEKTAPNVITEKEELLKEYSKIRENGYVLSTDELGFEIVGVGIPLFSNDGKIKACVAVAFYRYDDYEQRQLKFKDILLEYKSTLEQYLPTL
ncbi:MAG: IclR family transcriptional regulator [Anaerovoracaceae bacterium]